MKPGVSKAGIVAVFIPPRTASIRPIRCGRSSYAQKMEWTDMIKAGIIDPAKVTRSALQNAASVAALLDQHAIPAFSRCEFPACWPTTECAITDITESKAAPAGGPGMGGMGGMGGMDY